MILKGFTILALPFSALLATPAQAITYSASAGSFGPVASCGTTPGSQLSNQDGPTSVTYTSDDNGCGAAAEASAEEGVLSLRASVAIDIPSDPPPADWAVPFPDGVANAGASLFGTFNIEAAEGYTNEQLLDLHGNTIDLSTSLEISAQLANSMGVHRNFTIGGGSSLTASARLGPNDLFTTSWFSNVKNGPGDPILEDDLFINETITVSSTENWSNPVSIFMSLSGRAGSENFAGGRFLTSSVDSANSFSFTSVGPVFDLPKGFTVNSAGLGIVNNRWIDPRISVSPIPLPAGLPLILAGLGFLACLKRQRSI